MHDGLFQIPDVVYKLTSLTHLFLRFNRIRVVDEEIRYLKVWFGHVLFQLLAI